LDNFFDDLGEFVKSIFDGSIFSSKGKTYSDPYMQEAMDELDDYLNEGKENTAGKKSNKTSSSKNYRSSGNSGYSSRKNSEMENLKQDFANLEVLFGSPLAKVKASYKKLLRQYHPDKHADDPEKLKIATEITKKINASYNRIKAYYKK
jgi:DnaJ-domain-containing protein 1